MISISVDCAKQSVFLRIQVRAGSQTKGVVQSTILKAEHLLSF